MQKNKADAFGIAPAGFIWPAGLALRRRATAFGFMREVTPTCTT